MLRQNFQQSHLFSWSSIDFKYYLSSQPAFSLNYLKVNFSSSDILSTQNVACWVCTNSSDEMSNTFESILKRDLVSPEAFQFCSFGGNQAAEAQHCPPEWGKQLLRTKIQIKSSLLILFSLILLLQTSVCMHKAGLSWIGYYVTFEITF